jgi:hypothetical protein
MADMVVIPFPGIGTLAMTREQFNAALTAGSALIGTGAPHALKELGDVAPSIPPKQNQAVAWSSCRMNS